MSLELSKYKLNKVIEYTFLFCLTLHLFFWGSFQFIEYKFQLAGLNLLNPKIGISIIFFYYLFHNYKSFLKSNSILIFIFSLLLFHLFFNFDNNFFSFRKSLQLLIIFFIFIVCNNYYNFIQKNLEKIIFLFLIIIFSVLVYDFFSISFLNKFQYRKTLFYEFFFAENAHIGITVVPIIFYLIFNKNQFLFSSILGLVIAFISLFLFYSTTLVAGLVLALLFSLFFCFNEFLKRYILISALIIVCCSSLYLSNYFKIYERNITNDSKLYSFINLNKNYELTKHSNFKSEYFYLTTCEEPITNENYSNILENHIGNIRLFFITNYNCLPWRDPDKLDLIFNHKADLTISILINSAKVAFFSVKNKFYGYGINNYESAFAKHMINDIIPVYRETYLLNYNDSSSSFIKLISEFGIFSILFFYVFIKYSLSSKVPAECKLFFVSIILVQFGRGVGYINGGFAFSFAIMLSHFFNNTKNSFFKKKYD